MAVVVSKELNPRLEVEDDVTRRMGRLVEGCLSWCSWLFFQLQDCGEAHIQSDVQDSDCPRMEVLPWTFRGDL